MHAQLMQRQQAAAHGAPIDLQCLRNEVDRCTALTEGRLALARLDPERPESLAKEAVDLNALFGRRWHRGRRESTRVDAAVQVDARGQQALLRRFMARRCVSSEGSDGD